MNIQSIWGAATAATKVRNIVDQEIVGWLGLEILILVLELSHVEYQFDCVHYRQKFLLR